ncbi:hypothetical protein [Methanobrevibacter sp.]|uniref:hypothetical protein n=1 Tax=Methanobrevibacter sp. TaxID=66852 RepID=UPI002605ED67|nr:hypothetical protein [uncultured Methanobrevibacter sp.]
MNKKLLAIIIIITIVGLAVILYIDNGSYEEELSVISEGEWIGYYELTSNGTTTHETIMGPGPLDFTIKRQNGDKLLVYVNSTSYGSNKDLEIKILKNKEIVAENSSSNHTAGVWLHN